MARSTPKQEFMDRFDPWGLNRLTMRPPWRDRRTMMPFSRSKKETWAQLEDDMFCPECGATLSSLDKVCSACSTRVEPDKSVPIPVTVPAYRKSGFGILGITRTVLKTLSEGRVIRSSIAIVLQVAAVLVLLAGLLALIPILKLSFQFPSATATVGGLGVAICLAAAVIAISQIYLFRAQSIRELEESPFTVLGP